MANQDTTAATIRERMEWSWRQWQEALERMPSDRLADAAVCGEWTAKDLIGHIAVWDAVAIDKIREVQQGVPWVPEVVDERNAREAEARRQRSLSEQREEMDTTHDRLLAAVDSAATLSSDDLERINAMIAEDTWEHYDDHAGEVVRWLSEHDH